MVTRVEQERRLSERLVGQELPDVELVVASHSLTIPLRQHLIGVTILYFVPGENEGRAWHGDAPTPDASQHRGYVRREPDFAKRGAKVMGVASQPTEELLRIGRFLRANHMLLSDEQLGLACALGLPTDEQNHYRRVVLVADGQRITKMFLAAEHHEAAGSARGVLAWLEAQ